MSRTANSITTGSAWNRRAANSNASDDPRSSHCASSTTHNNGFSAASSASNVNVAAPIRNGVVAVSLLNPNAPRNAAACGPGSESSRSRYGYSNRCSAPNASSASDSMPTPRNTRMS